jgi:hypothetical protein
MPYVTEFQFTASLTLAALHTTAGGIPMCPFIRFARLSFAAILIFAISITATPAQQQNTTPPAPVPAQILAAQKVFIANGAGELPLTLDFPDPTYNEFYAAVKSLGRYALAARPGEADLVFQVSCRWYVGPTTADYANYSYYLRVIVIDPKTGTHLWGFSEPIKWWLKGKSNARANYEEAMNKLLADVKALAPVPAAKQ